MIALIAFVLLAAIGLLTGSPALIGIGGIGSIIALGRWVINALIDAASASIRGKL